MRGTLSETVRTKMANHDAFWRGEGPCLILIPPARQELYDLEGYAERFRDPDAMWRSELSRAEPVVSWPTDGIPTVRPNLGVVFVPAMAGLSYELVPGSMPWPGEPLEPARILAARGVDVAATESMRLAERFYAAHGSARMSEVAAYHADTQGVFDIAHLLRGGELFLEVRDPSRRAWIRDLLDVSQELYVRATRHLKRLLGEPDGSMIHGHGASQGAYFPSAGVRMAEDTATLLAPASIAELVLPAIERAGGSFGGAFVHFCGKREDFFRELCRLPCVRAIDLGNPERYEARPLLEACSETGTVLFSRLCAEPGETWERYVRRLAAVVRDTASRVILRPDVFPESRDACAAMRDLWHELTS